MENIMRMPRFISDHWGKGLTYALGAGISYVMPIVGLPILLGKMGHDLGDMLFKKYDLFDEKVGGDGALMGLIGGLVIGAIIHAQVPKYDQEIVSVDNISYDRISKIYDSTNMAHTLPFQFGDEYELKGYFVNVGDASVCFFGDYPNPYYGLKEENGKIIVGKPFIQLSSKDLDNAFPGNVAILAEEQDEVFQKFGDNCRHHLDDFLDDPNNFEDVSELRDNMNNLYSSHSRN